MLSNPKASSQQPSKRIVVRLLYAGLVSLAIILMVFLPLIITPSFDQSDVLKNAIACAPEAIQKFQDTGKVITFTLKGAHSNFTESHRESPYLFNVYVVKWGTGRRAIYKTILDPNRIQIEDSGGTRFTVESALPRFMKELSAIGRDKKVPETFPKSVQNSPFDTITAYAVEKEKPITFVATIVSSHSELLLRGPDSEHGPVISNMSVVQMKEFNDKQVRDNTNTYLLLFAPVALIIIMCVVAVFLSTNSKK
jgi:hypothetical protein